MIAQNDNESSKSTLQALLLALIFTALYLLLMPPVMLWDRDETLYARTAMEMLQSGNYLIPTYNGALFAHKPPMLYWLTSISLDIFGNNEFGARFISGPAMGIVSFVTYLIGRRMFDHQVGLWALIMTGTSLLGVYLGTSIMHDPILMVCVCTAIYAYVETIYKPQRFIAMVALFTFAMTVALYIKGPVGPAVVVTTVFFSWLMLAKGERPSFLRMVIFAIGSLVALALFMFWVIPANTQTDGQLLRDGVGRHIIGRALAPMENHGGTGILGFFLYLPIYIPVAIVGFLPWTIHLPAAFYALIKRTIGTQRERAILWGWMVPTFVMFSVAATKLPHYIFPIFPALAILASAVMVKANNKIVPFSKFGAWLYLWLSPGLGFGLIVVPLFFPQYFSPFIGVPVGILMLLIVFIVFRNQVVGYSRYASYVLLAITPFVLVFTYWVIVPAVDPLFKVSKAVAEAIEESDGPKDNLYWDDYFEPSLVFYVNPSFDRPFQKSYSNSEDLARFLEEQTDDMLLVVKEENFSRYLEQQGDRPFDVIKRFEAFNTNADGENQILILAKRAGVE